MMRIITGTARGRRLIAPEGMDVRPTTDKVKEALFSIIQFDIEGRSVLDLFAGSGQLGLEAVSRGADHAVFIDNSKRSVEAVKKNIAASGFDKKCKVLLSDAFSFLDNSNEKFDIVFLDPPYEQQLCVKASELLPRVIKNTSIVICETRTNEILPEKIGQLDHYKEYHYSSIKLTVYR